MIKLRAAHQEDAGVISCVIAASWKSAYRGIIHDNFLVALGYDHWQNFLISGMESGGIFVNVLEDEQGIIGAAILHAPEKDGVVHLVSFYLLPDKIGQGLGYVFFSLLESDLKSRGFAKCVLDVLEKNKRAINFYQAHGFINAQNKISTVLGNETYFCLRFEKFLR